MKPLLFPAKLAARLGRLAFNRRSGRLGHHKGTHLSKKSGASMEFSDFKEYHPGDDIRHIDWNVYARTDTYFIKQFLDEQEMRIHVLLDSSKSMDFGGKWPFAQQLAIGLGQIALKNGDTASLSRTPDPAVVRRKGARQADAWSARIAAFPVPEENTGLQEGIPSIPRGTTILFVITDALEPAEVLEQTFRKLKARCQDIRLLIVRSADEQQPAFEGDVRLIDAEQDTAAEVSMTAASVSAYTRRMEEHERRLLGHAGKYGISVLYTSPADGAEDVFTRQMRRAQWVR
ncbi:MULTISPECIES: DUF58 domain-containing protein [Sporosarcina]|uniref:DUF58 domain-containing protein n=1 Tax=Sporosarcina TaxID=1569 RepID=UPI00058C6045|nr:MULTISPECIES: DUF58 domain-containing protein [Sporosarcina]WJY28883.1 DUF58 domain-containing protein [Sporosarcina sp. 0.2-SM1T-5]